MANVHVKSVENIGQMFVVNKFSVLGHDGAYSIPLDDHRVFWTFGDTLLGVERLGYDPEKILLDEWLASKWAKENIKMIGNSACFTNTENARELITTSPVYIRNKNGSKVREIIPSTLAPDRAGRYRPLWPMDGICLDGKLYIFYIAVDCGPADPSSQNALDINVYGAGVAKACFPYTEFIRLTPTVYPAVPRDIANYCEYPYLWWNCDLDENMNQVPAFGTAVLKETIDDYVYVFGSGVRTIGTRIRHGVFLARVASSQIEDVTKYEYLLDSSPTWDTDPKNAKMLFDGNANELSISYNRYLGKFIAVYPFIGKAKQNGSVEHFLEEIHLRFADNIWGPWSDPIVIHKCRKSCPNDVCYAAKEHPEFCEEQGKVIYVTYVSHQRYWPELLKVVFT